jgi:hypothetical protein
MTDCACTQFSADACQRLDHNPLMLTVVCEHCGLVQPYRYGGCWKCGHLYVMMTTS